VTTPTTREQAIDALIAREGAPREHFDSCITEAIFAAAAAPEGQPCADCGDLITWDETVQDWRHTHTPTGCFLAREDER
jgi:hypothetical protein